MVGLVKSVQQVQITLGAGVASANLTIGAVDATKTALFYQGVSSTTSNSALSEEAAVSITLVNGTTVSASRGATGDTVTVSFMVVEFMPSAINSVQYGTISIAAAATSGTATISTVGSLAFVLFLGATCTSTGQLQSSTRTAVALTNSTTVTAFANGAANMTIGYVVIDPTSALVASVQQLNHLESLTTTTSYSDTITSVDTTRSMILRNGIVAVSGVAASIEHTIVLTNATTVTMTRNGAGAIVRTMYYTVVQFQAAAMGGVAAQRGTMKIAAATSSNTATVTSVDTSRAVANWNGFLSNAFTNEQNGASFISLTNGSTITANQSTGATTAAPTSAYELVMFGTLRVAATLGAAAGVSGAPKAAVKNAASPLGTSHGVATGAKGMARSTSALTTAHAVVNATRSGRKVAATVSVLVSALATAVKSARKLAGALVAIVGVTGQTKSKVKESASPLVTLTALARPWTPLDLPNIYLWFSPSDLVDGAVTTWTDRIMGMPVFVGAGANSPLKASASLNGAYSGLTFDGSFMYLDTFDQTYLTRLPIGTSSCDLFAIVDQQSTYPGTPRTNNIFGYGSDTVEGTRTIRAAHTSTTTNGFAAHDRDITVIDTSVSFMGVHIVNGRFDASLLTVFIDGSAGSPASTAASLNTGTTQFRIGHRTASVVISPPAPPQTMEEMLGVIGDIIVATLTQPDRDRLFGWYAWTHGAVYLLGASHPYKAAAPMVSLASARSSMKAASPVGSVAMGAASITRAAARPIGTLGVRVDLLRATRAAQRLTVTLSAQAALSSLPKLRRFAAASLGATASLVGGGRAKAKDGAALGVSTGVAAVSRAKTKGAAGVSATSGVGVSARAGRKAAAQLAVASGVQAPQTRAGRVAAAFLTARAGAMSSAGRGAFAATTFGIAAGIAELVTEVIHFVSKPSLTGSKKSPSLTGSIKDE